jgi:hypothetical protein
MPRKPIDYSKCKFYQLVCKDVTIKECYVGCTTDVKSRRSNHKSSCTNKKGKNYNLFVYKFIREHGSWTNWQLIVHETAAMKNKADADLRERHWLVHYNATLNSNVPGQTQAEHYVAHVKEIKAACASYYAANADKVKAYYEANADRLKEKHECECGGCYATQKKSRHFKTAKHLAFAAK